MLTWLWEKLRGSSRAPDDLALGTTRPGDFAEPPSEAVEDLGAVESNPHEETTVDDGRKKTAP
jgi:hypothetical protein